MHKLFHLQTSLAYFLSISTKEGILFYIYFLPQISAPQGTALLVRSLPMKSRKGLAPVMADTFATHAGFAYDVTGTGRWAQNGSTHSCCSFFFFFTFKH